MLKKLKECEKVESLKKENEQLKKEIENFSSQLSQLEVRHRTLEQIKIDLENRKRKTQKDYNEYVKEHELELIFDPEKTIEVTERQAKFPKNPSQFIDCFSDTKTVIQKYSIFDISAIIIINAISNFDENIKPSLCPQIVPKGIKFMEIATTRKIKGQLISKIDPIARLILQTAELMYKQINWANPPIITDFSCDCIKQICNDGEAVYEKKEKLSKELYVANELIKKKTEEIEQLVKQINKLNTKIQEKKKRESEITTSIAQIIEYQHLYGTPEKQEEITITIKSAEEDIRSVEIAIAKNDEELKALNDQLRQIDIELKHKQEILVVRAKSREIIPEIAQNSTDAILKRAAAYIQLGGLYRTYFSASFNDVEDISSQDAIDTISTQIVGRIPTGTAITGTLTAQFGAIWEQIRTNLNSDSENYTQWASNALLPIEKVLLFLSVSTNSSVASNSPAEITVQKLLIDSPKTPVHTQVQAEFFRHIAKHFWSIDIMKQKLPFKEEDLGNRDLPLQGASDVHTALEYESSAARSFSEENAKKVARGFMRIFAGTEGVSSWRSFTDDEGKPQIEIMRKVPFNERFHDINGTYKFKQGWYITRDSVDPEVVDNSSISEIYFRMRLDFSEGWNIFVTTYPVFQYESEQ